MPCTKEYEELMQTKSDTASDATHTGCWGGSAVRGLTSIVLILFVGCAAGPKYDGPTVAVPFSSQPWSYKSAPGSLLKTAHYNIYTTETMPDVLRCLPQVMEGALGEYQKIAPGVPLTNRPMDCYLFANKGQWIEFTRQHTGPQAAV
jgi:hypothetical protein